MRLRCQLVALQVLLYAAVNYLALHACTLPRYLHLTLDTEEDWAAIERMIELVAHRVLDRDPEP